jgi:hypothetical protein
MQKQSTEAPPAVRSYLATPRHSHNVFVCSTTGLMHVKCEVLPQSLRLLHLPSRIRGAAGPRGNS